MAETIRKNKHKPGHLKLIIVLAVFVVLMVFVYYRYTQTFSYQYTAAKQADQKKNYEEAIGHYQNALRSDNSDVRVLYALANDYSRLKRTSMAERYLLRAIKTDGTYLRAFRLLLTIYEDNGDYEKMEAAYQYASSDEVKELFRDYLIRPPVFSVEGGKFDDDVTLTLGLPEGGEDYEIFYTTDGKAPNGVNGHLYDGVIYLTEGKTRVRAVCRNDNGKFGEVAEQTYQIKYVKPSEPKVSPNGGDFTEKTKVTITADEDCTLYYSWKNQKPTQKSKKYTGPITVPEGYHVLSVVAYDRHGLKSKTYHMGFSYYRSREE